MVQPVVEVTNGTGYTGHMYPRLRPVNQYGLYHSLVKKRGDLCVFNLLPQYRQHFPTVSTIPKYSKSPPPSHHWMPLSCSPGIYRMILWRGDILMHGIPPLPPFLMSLPLPYIFVSCPKFTCTLLCRGAAR